MFEKSSLPVLPVAVAVSSWAADAFGANANPINARLSTTSSRRSDLERTKTDICFLLPPRLWCAGKGSLRGAPVSRNDSYGFPALSG
jgi:hypothetical protein